MSKRLLKKEGERGAALIEFALVIPIFVFVLYALIAFGMMLALKQSATSAASDGARAAIAARPVGSETIAQAQVRVAKAKVDSALDWLGSKYDPNDTTAVVANCAGASGPQCITVTVTYPYESRPLVPTAPGLNLVTPNYITTSAVVQVS